MMPGFEGWPSGGGTFLDKLGTLWGPSREWRQSGVTQGSAINDFQMSPVRFSGNVLEEAGKEIQAGDYSKSRFQGQLLFPHQQPGEGQSGNKGVHPREGEPTPQAEG